MIVCINSFRLSCLLDTGAVFSVWCGDYLNIRKYFPNARLCREGIRLSGVCGEVECKVVWVPEFVLTFNNGVVRIKNMYFALREGLRASAKAILSWPVFAGSAVLLDTRNSKVCEPKIMMSDVVECRPLLGDGRFRGLAVLHGGTCREWLLP